MSEHSVAEAKNRLPELIDRAIAGEGVVITRHGRPVVEIRAIEPPARPISDAELDWLAEMRRSMGEPGPTDAGSLVSQMRDEDWR